MRYLRTIKAKMIFAFSIFFTIQILIIASNLWFNTKKERITRIMSTLATIDRKVQFIIKLEKDFFTDETVNSDFYATEISGYLRQRDVQLKQVQDNIYILHKLEEKASYGIKDELDSLTKKLIEYDLVFQNVIKAIKKRGFKDHGLEGKMRRYIHEIELASDEFIDPVLLLTIRRHEKDYILRKDTNYLKKLLRVIDLLKKSIKTKITNKTDHDRYITLIDNYADTFSQLVETEQLIGTDHRKDGMKNTLMNIASDATRQINDINDTAITRSTYIRHNIQIMLVAIIIIGIVFSVSIALYTTKILSKPVIELSTGIRSVVASDFATDITLNDFNTNDEIGRLAKDFMLMLQRVQDNISEIQDKSTKIEHKQKQLLDSLRYAQQIQDAILPDQNELLEHFTEYFVLYRPQHFVSGDFYWFVEKYEKKFLAVVDCTGHGVPGAFMSMIGHTLLTKIITQDKIFDPAKILENLHHEIKKALHQEAKKNDDGMDVCMCVIENHSNTSEDIQLSYVGAKIPLYYSNNEGLSILKGINRSIGGRFKSVHKAFTSTEITLPKKSMLYLCTDGMVDQNNSSNEKYGKKMLLNLLEAVSKHDTNMQKILIEEELMDFMNGQIQRDDITIMGVRL